MPLCRPLRIGINYALSPFYPMMRGRGSVAATFPRTATTASSRTPSMTTPADLSRPAPGSQPAANTSRYTRTAMILHWIIALGIICNVLLIWSVDALPDDWVRPVIDTHKSIGITVLGLVLLRILWRIGHRPPSLPDAFPAWERASAHAAHWLLYGVMLGLPLSGWLHDSAWKDAATHPLTLFHLVPWPRIGFVMNQEPHFREHLHDLFGTVHAGFGYALYALLALHIGGALKHELIDRESVLRRMLP
jgi:cytochrome b561